MGCVFDHPQNISLFCNGGSTIKSLEYRYGQDKTGAPPYALAKGKVLE